ncbi:MAG: hypothetical protein V3W41_08915 [Planctomycetota bacterium]
MSSSLGRKLVLWGFLALALAPSTFAQEEEATPADALAAEVRIEIDLLLKSELLVWRNFATVFDACMIHHGDLDALTAAFESQLRDSGISSTRRARLIRLQAACLRRFGEKEAALETLGKLAADSISLSDRRQRAELLDAAGKDQDALVEYKKLASLMKDVELKNRILLRIALLTKEGDDKTKSPLAEFAKGAARSETLRNQAAMILSLQEGQKDALELFVTSGEGSKLYRQLIRLAEWALEAKDWKKAQGYCWRAVEAAQLKRDRRYALTILVEGYRRADDLDGLIDTLAKTEGLDDEARGVWIDLLRETGRVQEALRLFRNSGDGTFTVDMRRELLDMCRQTGEDETLIGAYQKLISEEPRYIEWRTGLTRFYLERGNRPAALAVWDGFGDDGGDDNLVLAAADALGNLGLDELAASFARKTARTGAEKARAGLFLFDLFFRRGRLDLAELELDAVAKVLDRGEDLRMDLAGAYERLGKKKRSVEILEGLSQERGERTAGDMEMKLALLLSDIGEEDKALKRWMDLWQRIQSIPRRRYVEERLMTIAARLGELAKIAISLEKRLADGEANDRESGLLVRIYTRVKDAISATDVIDEYMKQTSGNPIETLAEKARVYLTCLDYFNYEETIEKLIEVDAENAADYYRQLAMSRLERGQRQEAREILDRLKGEDAGTSSDEFEAGVLAMAGMRKESIAVYRRGIARNPGRIDNYLLLSNVMKDLGQFDRSAAMFQYLAETAERDDLFTIAIDGILNMRDGRTNRGAPDRLIEWARRITLERIARRPNKLYLFQLAADLSDELGDKATAVRALKAALPIAGEQRTYLLRELISMTKPKVRSAFASFIVIGGVLVTQDVASSTSSLDLKEQNLMFGRRLLGQGELVPPGVYLELGETFLREQEVANASRTFSQAAKLPDFAAFQRKIAASFEAARYDDEAIRVYERILTVETSDLSLLTRVAEMREKLGYDEIARGLFLRATKVMLDKRPFSKSKSKDKEIDESIPAYMRRELNVTESDSEKEFILKGLLSTLTFENALVFLDDQGKELDAELRLVMDAGEDRGERLDRYPRLAHRSRLYRRIALAHGQLERADRVDAQLLQSFLKDENLLPEIVRFRARWGYNASALNLIAASGRPESIRNGLALLAGGKVEGGDGARVSVAEMATLAMPLVVAGRNDDAIALLERIDFGVGDKTELDDLPMLVSVAAFLEVPDQVLTLCRRWLDMTVKHKTSSLYEVVESLLRASQTVLDQQQGESLIQYLVDKICKSPDKFSSFASRIPDLQKSLGITLLTAEQAEKLIESKLETSERSVYAIPRLLLMIDAEAQSTTLRKIWPKVKKTLRATFVLQLVPEFSYDIEPGYADLLIESFKAGMNDVERDRILESGVSSLAASSKFNVDLRLSLIDLIASKSSKSMSCQLAKAQIFVGDGRVVEGFALAKEPIKELLTMKNPGWESSYALDQALVVFRRTNFDELLALFDEVLKEGKNESLVLRRVTFLDGKVPASEILASLRQALGRFPKNVTIRQALQRRLNRGGYRRAALAELAKIAEIEPKKDQHKTALIRGWTAARNPVRALKLEREKAKKASEEAETSGGSNKKKPRERSTIRGVKKALDAGDTKTAHRMFHELWRRFPDRTSQYFRSSWAFSSFSRVPDLRWPKDRETDAETKVSRGGLPGFEPKTENRDKVAKRRSAYEVLAEHAFGAAEINRMLSTLGAESFSSSGAGEILKVKAKARVSRLGRERAIADILDADAKGRAGKLDYGILFAILESAEGDIDPKVEQSVDELVRVISPRDEGQTRRLARLYAALGKKDRAALLWRWSIAVAGDDNNRYGGISRELIDQIIAALDGEARIEVLEDIFRATAPSPEYYWGQDRHTTQVLKTWIEVLGPDATWERCTKTLEEIFVLGSAPRRGAAKIAAGLAARRGDIDLAMRYLEIGLLKLEFPQGLRPWLRIGFEDGGRLSNVELAELFPKGFEGWDDANAWLNAVSERIPKWIEEGRVDVERLFSLEAILALRFFEQGDEDRARSWLASVAKKAVGNAGRELWVVDLARQFGDEDRAWSIEKKLLTEDRLHLERLAEVISRWAAKDGKASALEVGERVAAWCQHPLLLDVLIQLSHELGREDRKQHWEECKQAGEAAKKELEESKSKA